MQATSVQIHETREMREMREIDSVYSTSSYTAVNYSLTMMQPADNDPAPPVHRTADNSGFRRDIAIRNIGRVGVVDFREIIISIQCISNYVFFFFSEL